MIRRLIDRIFRLEEINGRERCPTYLYRWTLAKFGPYSLYLHHFVRDDWSLDLHDHPKRFISIGLKGGYTEITPKGRTTFRSPWVRTFPAEHVHRLQMARGWLGEIRDCWTLVITLKAVRPWGFWHLGNFIPWREYVGSAAADERKSCD